MTTPETGKARPFILTLFCLFSFVSFGLITLLLMISIFYSGTFYSLINTYVVGEPVSRAGVFFTILILMLLYGTAFTGIFFIWKMKRTGLFLFGIPALFIAVYQLFQSDIPVLSTIILICLLLVFGLYFRHYH